MRITSNIPGARFSSYALWRAWVLVAYTAPIWSLHGSTIEQEAWSAMYLWSTLAFAIVAILLAVMHERAVSILANNMFVLAAGVLATCGMFAEYAALAMDSISIGALFIFGAVATGIGTAPIALRAGWVYATAPSGTALTYTALSEAFAGLVYFLVIGTLPWASLAIAAALPLLASLMSLFEEAGEDEMIAVDVGASVDKKSLAVFVRFLCMVLILTFAASFMRAILNANVTEIAFANGNIPGITFVVVFAFSLALIGSVLKDFNFGTIYYPLVLAMAAALAFAFASSGEQLGYVQAVSTAVYSLFNMFMWCILTYVAHSALLNPVQTFGFGRAAFAAGSLLGILAGQQNIGTLFGNADSATTIGGFLAFALIAAAMLLFRERDVDLLSKQLNPVIEDAFVTTDSLKQIELDFQDTIPSEAPDTISPTEFADAHNLTAREREVFLLMLDGADSKTISEHLVISNNTAKAHIRNIYLKTEVRTRKEFTAATIQVKRS